MRLTSGLTAPSSAFHTRRKENGRHVALEQMRILVVVLAVCNLPFISWAQTQFSTFSGSLPRYYGIGPGIDTWGVSFVTDGSTYLLDSITLGVASRSATPDTFTAGLYPGDGFGQTLLEPLADSILTASTTSLTFESGNQVLLPDTR
jgi:hypothetical protein